MSLYLKYRPQDFDNLEWQEFIKNTLRKAIADNKTVGAYLLCGPRWTWKTSTARIFAKSLNCENPSEWNPCLTCWICKDFLDESLIDIIEIDAASHTGVDNIRDIIEKAEFKPTRTKYKVYIIDEVHMLSKWAFNALLKILEEPPEHVKFILATTETHKVPETIISRCQRYDFRRIWDIEIKNRITYIAESEKVNIDDKSLDYIIKSAGWGLRNAISTFEQLIVDGAIKYENIIDNLWIVWSEELENFLNKLLSKDKDIIKDFDFLIQEGKNIKLFFKEFIFFAKQRALLDITEWKEIDDIVYIMDVLDETYSKTKNSLDENTTFLIWLLKLLSNWSAHTQKIQSSTNLKQKPLKIPENKREAKETLKSDPKVTSDDEINIEDIWGLFDDSEKGSKEQTWNFDKNTFITHLKDLGAKGSLILWIRSSNVSLDNNVLKVQFKTSFALKSTDNSDNRSLISEALNKMDLFDIDIQLL